MRLVKRLLALSAAFILLSMQLFPLTANAMREAAPDEKVIAQSGRWQNEMSTNFSTGQTKIYSRYIGNTSQNDKKPPEPFKFSVLTAVRLTKIHIEHNVSKNKIPQGDKDIAISVDLDEKGPGAGVNKFSNIVVSITSKDGTVYGPYYAELNLAGMSQDYAPKTVCATVSFNGSMFLERGSYTLTLENMDTAIYNNETGNAPATVIVGMDKERWESYEKRRNSDILKGIGKEDVKKDENERDDKQQDGQGENKADIKSSDDEIDKIIEIGKELAAKQKKAEEEKEKQTGEKPQFKEALFELTEEAYIDEIQTDHFNGGNGSAPGSIQLFSINDDGSVKKKEGQWNAKGLKVDKTPNAVWSASPDVVLPAGKYKIVDSNTNTLSYDSASLEPIFYVRAIDPPSFNFTGTYFIDIKTAVASSLNKSKIGQGTPFDRQGFELTVIDRGTVMELIGRYTQEKKKDMFFPEKTTGYDFKDVPFSQLCEVTKRDRTKATAEFKLDVNLKNLPYKAQVGTNVIFDFDSEGGIPKVKATGSAFYSRAYKEGYGGDFNTYTVNIKGQRHSEQLPHYVTAQINAMINNIGNIPGPESAAQAAMGAIFPSLAALVVQIGMTMKKPKYIPPEPEGGEGGEGKGPVRDGSDGSDSTDEYENEENESEDSEEQTDEGYGAPLDPSQQIEGFVAGQKSDLENERDEWIRNLEESKKSADPSDPRTQELHKQYEDYINYLNDKIEGLKAPSGDSLGGPRTVTLQFDHTGRTAEIAYDPESGGWYNTESGKPFDMDRYQRDVAPKFQSTRDFLAEQRNKLETGDNAFDRAMKALIEENRQRSRLLGQLQKIRNQSYGITPPSEGVGDVQANIKKLIDDLSNRDIPLSELQSKASKIAKVVTGRNTGRTGGEELLTQAEKDLSFTSLAANTAVEGSLDVLQGRTWAGMAGRAGLAALTGGMSEVPLNVGEAMVNIRDSINNDESAGKAVAKAIGQYLTGELGGEYLGAAWKRTGLQVNPDLVKKVTDIGNTPVSKLFTKGSVAGTRESIEKLTSSAGKRFMGELDGQAGKYADDIVEYSKYKAGVNNQVSAIEGKIRTGQPLDPDEIRNVLKDPSASRTLKGSHQSIQDGYVKELNEKLYNSSFSKTKAQLEADPGTASMVEKLKGKHGGNPGAKVEVEVGTVRTPGSKGSAINADNDVTGKIVVTDPKAVTPSNPRGIIDEIEIPASKVSKHYNENFAEAAGFMKNGKFDTAKAKLEFPEGIPVTGKDGRTRMVDWDKATPDQQLDYFAKKHNQEVTDVFNPEAAADFNTAKSPSHVSNVGQLKNGVSGAKLSDPAGLAQMEKYKIDSWFNKGGIANQTEAYEQLSKMGKLTNDLTSAYQKLGYNVQNLPPNMEKALDIVSNRNLSPGTRTLELKKLGFDGPGDLANKLSGRIEGMQKLGAPKPGASGDKDRVLNNVVSIITKSYLNNKGKE